MLKLKKEFRRQKVKLEHSPTVCHCAVGTLLKQCIKGNIEGRIEVTGRRGRRLKRLLYYLEEKRGYWQLTEETLDRTLWGTGFKRTDCGMNEWVTSAVLLQGCLAAT